MITHIKKGITAIINVLKPVYKAWMKVAHAISWVMTRVILTIVFYLVVTPIGLIGRVFSKEFLDRSFDRDKETYWIPNPNKEFDKNSCENQF